MIVMNATLRALEVNPLSLVIPIAALSAGTAMGLSSWLKGRVGAAASIALGETGRGFINYLMVLGVIETVSLFVMVFVTKAHFATKPHEQSKETSDRIYHLPDDDLIDINFLLKDADILVTDYFNAHKLINAKTSSYLISKKLPSPMGGFLSAYATEANADK